MVREAKYPRLQWPLGRVTQLFPGRDGKIRSVQIKTSKGKTLTRSVQLLHELEISDNPPDNLVSQPADKPSTVEVDSSQNDPPVITTRRGRPIKPKSRLDL